jgi:hypothetical protein
LHLIRRLGAYFLPSWKQMVSPLPCMAVVGATAAVRAWLVEPVLDRGQGRSGEYAPSCRVQFGGGWGSG